MSAPETAATAPGASPAGRVTTPSPASGRRDGRRDRRRLGGSLVAGLVLVGVVVGAALVSFVWTPYDPTGVFPAETLLPPGGSHLLGTDSYGRDILSSLLVGSRITLLVGCVAVGIALAVGVPMGVAAGMRGGRTDTALMRVNDVLLAFPALLLAIIFGAVWGADTVTAMIALGIGSAPSFARVTRAATLQVMSREYVLAARAAGRSPWQIAVRHVLANIAGVVIVQSSVSFAIAVLSEAALSYLGFGTRPPTPSWGRMLQEAQAYLYVEPLLVLWPGLAVALAVMGFNLLGDGLRDRFDPRMEIAR